MLLGCNYTVRQQIGLFLIVNKKLKVLCIMKRYIYKEVHTLAFAEISESVVLKHNTEQKKKHNTSFHSKIEKHCCQIA
jgi:hypothetical protein